MSEHQFDPKGKPAGGSEPGKELSGLQRRIRGFRLATWYQTSGETYLARRKEEAITRRDTRWIDDTEKYQSLPMWIGIGGGLVVGVACLIGAMIWPAGKVDDAQIVMNSESGEVYVRIGDALSPTNLTSARLIIGSPDKPVSAKGSEISKIPRGQAVGIEGAPEVTNSTSRDSKWAVCDTAATGSAVPLDPSTGLPTTATAPVKVTVIGGDLTLGEGTEKVTGDQARLMSYRGQTWLVYVDKGQVVRALIDLRETAVADALGIDDRTPVAPMSTGLFNVIEARQPIAVPSIHDLGRPVRFGNTENLAIGTTLRTKTVSGDWLYYVATSDGVQQVSLPAAAVLQQTSPIKTGIVELPADKVAQWPKATGRVAVDHFPTSKVTVADTTSTPVTCATWERNGSDPAATQSVFTARTLPLKPEQAAAVIPLVSAKGSQGTIADQAYMPPNGGRYVQITGAAADSRETGGTFWIADRGVRYGIDDLGAQDSRGESAAALGLRDPVPVPWNIASLFAPGPTLSKNRALIRLDAPLQNPNVEKFDPPKSKK